MLICSSVISFINVLSVTEKNYAAMYLEKIFKKIITSCFELHVNDMIAGDCWMFVQKHIQLGIN